MDSRPFVFVGSSKKGLPIAKALQTGLKESCDVTVWNQGIFEPSLGFMESLTRALETADFAILVLTPDDFVKNENVEISAPRDNVIFELGLFIGKLGRRRCFFVYEENVPIKLPTDLLGIVGSTFLKRSDNDLVPALAPICHSIENRYRELGLRTRMLNFSADDMLPRSGHLDISGDWAGYSPDCPKPDLQNSTLSIEQHGSFVRAVVVRTGADGRKRVFDYEGRFTSGQLVLFYEDKLGRGYIVGTVVLHLSPDLCKLSGRATYFAHAKGMVVSRARIFIRNQKAT